MVSYRDVGQGCLEGHIDFCVMMTTKKRLLDPFKLDNNKDKKTQGPQF